jgi:hypothetical protein
MQSVARAVACWLIASLFPAIAAAQVAVAWNDFARGVGVVQLLRALRPWELRLRAIETGRDATLHYRFGRLYAVSRRDGTVTVITRRGGRVRTVIELGDRSEPEDIAVVTRRTAYVSRRSATHLLRLDPQTGATADVVDLSPFADADGRPELGAMIRDGDRLFVQIRRFNEDGPGGFAPPAYLAVVDLRTETLIDVDPLKPGTQAIELQGTSPKHRMQIVDETRSLLVSATGGFFDHGGIEVIDLDTLRSRGLVIRESDGMTGADLGPFVMVDADRGFLVYSTDLDLSSHLQPFSLSRGVDPGPNLHVSVGYAVPALVHEPRRGTFFLPDGVFQRQGVHVFDVESWSRLSDAPTAVTGLPSDILLLRSAP